MKKRICGGFVLISMLIALVVTLVMVPIAGGAKPVEGGCDDGEWDKSSLVGYCITIDNGVLTARVCNTSDKEMLGTTTWKLYWVASGNPKNATNPIATGGIPALSGGDCTDITYDTLGPNPEGNYAFRVFQRPCHPGQGELWMTQVCDEPTPPVPEISTIALLSIGLVSLGGFIWLEKRKQTVEVI